MQKVRVYWNLHKKCWSVQLCKTNKVIAHKIHLVLETAQPIIRMGGQARVRDELKKNVHAFIQGFMRDEVIDHNEYGFEYKRVIYNPYEHDFFMVEESTDTYKEMDKNAYYSVLFETLNSEKGIHPRVYI